MKVYALSIQRFYLSGHIKKKKPVPYQIKFILIQPQNNKETSHYTNYNKNAKALCEKVTPVEMLPHELRR